ncbi:hypothetical protein N9Y60_03455 [Crocinitomicaceae bacterium]|jgi:hypothetical protein|nr:hypothetical protein [Crocinitomicaceae bacterium]
MIYKNEKWGDEKYYQIVSSYNGGFVLREYNNGAKRTEVDMSPQDKMNFVKLLKENDWYDFVRS